MSDKNPPEYFDVMRRDMAEDAKGHATDHVSGESDIAKTLRSPAMVFYSYDADDGEILRRALKEIDTQAATIRQLQAQLAALPTPSPADDKLMDEVEKALEEVVDVAEVGSDAQILVVALLARLRTWRQERRR